MMVGREKFRMNPKILREGHSRHHTEKTRTRHFGRKRTKVKHIIPIILRTKLTEIIGSIQKKLFGENTAKKGEENQEYNDRDQKPSF